MNLPWISRRAFDVVVSERDRLREQVDRLLEHHVRIERKQNGLSELEPQRKVVEPMPDWALAEVAAWATGDIRDKVEEGLLMDRDTLGSWEAVQRVRGFTKENEESDGA